MNKTNFINLQNNSRTKWRFSRFLEFCFDNGSFFFLNLSLWKIFSVFLLLCFDEGLCLSNNTRMPFYQTVATKYHFCYLQYLKLVKTLSDPRRQLQRNLHSLDHLTFRTKTEGKYNWHKNTFRGISFLVWTRAVKTAIKDFKSAVRIVRVNNEYFTELAPH